MRVSLLQSNLIWENIEENLKSFDRKINSIRYKTDLIILPEMFTTGFSMQPQQLAEKHLGKTFHQMKSWAKQKQAAILGSIVVEENNQFFNRAYFVFPNGEYQFYDKRHLFRMAKEDQYYSQGNQRVLIEYKGWKILPLICYDLRFPVWSRNNLDYDLLIYIANWPERRSLPWKTLLKARAIENLSYVVGLNRVGDDGNGIAHSGDSVLVDFKGLEKTTIKAHEEKIETVELSKNDLIQFRKKFPANVDADTFSINY